MDPKLPRYPVGFASALNQTAVAHAVVTNERARYLPLCDWEHGQVLAYSEHAFVQTVGQVRSYTPRFCRHCRPLLIASQEVEVEYYFERVTTGKGDDSNFMLMRSVDL